MGSLRILVADDHEIVRLGICSMLSSRDNWQVCGTATDGWEAVEQARRLHPDVVVIDVGMPRLNGLDAARRILKDDNSIRILILTLQDLEETIKAALQAGVHGFVLKSDVAQDLPSAISALERGGVFFTKPVGKMLLDDFRAQRRDERPLDGLTPRERQIVQLVAEGYCNKELATLLGLTGKTVETHRSNIMRKLDVHNVAELVLYAVRHHIIDVATTESAVGTETPLEPASNSSGRPQY
jgi:DNA-binding NarL/FixJ family response regulator